MGLKTPVVYLPLSVNKSVRLKDICAVLAAYRMVAVNNAEIVPIIMDLASAKWEKSWQRDLSWIGLAFDSPEKLGPFLFKKTFRQSERVTIYQQCLSQIEPAPGYHFFLKNINS
ncbi:hypothetical protein KAH55_03750, partial [bacterium]|nr:hypothetical protein [bacterium]